MHTAFQIGYHLGSGAEAVAVGHVARVLLLLVGHGAAVATVLL